MSENRKSEGLLLTLENVTAASNIAAGKLVAISGHTIYTLDSASTGFGNTGTMNYNFIGILDESISAGQSPITVWTEGVFQLPIDTAATSGNLYAGFPVAWGTSGVTTPGVEGDASIGTIVGMETFGNTGGGSVKESGVALIYIRPMALNWTIFATAALSATGPMPGAFPQLATH